MYKKLSIETFEQSSIQQKITSVNDLETSIEKTKKDFQQNYKDINNTIGLYTNTTNYLEKNNDIYHYNDNQDPNTLLLMNKPKGIKYVMNEDIKQIKLYQNTIYISGVIACATLLIAISLMQK